MKNNKTCSFILKNYRKGIKKVQKNGGIYFVIAQGDIFVREKPKNRRIPYSKKQRIQQFLIKKFNNYCDNQNQVLYIGSSNNLKRRISSLNSTMFKSSGSLSHKGGKYLSWIKNYDELIVKCIYCDHYENEETKRIGNFAKKHGFLPLANTKH